MPLLSEKFDEEEDADLLRLSKGAFGDSDSTPLPFPERLVELLTFNFGRSKAWLVEVVTMVEPGGNVYRHLWFLHGSCAVITGY
jgi:hypothetical protein